MAGTGSNQQQLLPIVNDSKDGYLLYSIDIGDLFSDGDGERVELLPLPPRPMAVFQPSARNEHMAFAVSGTTIVGLTATGAAGVGPAPGANKISPLLTPIGDAVLAMSLLPMWKPPPRFEALVPAAGERLWVSVAGRGTFSLDTARRAWRQEGDWELRLAGRALLVPEVGNLVFGFCPYRRCLCAYDLEKRPPAVRAMWEHTRPQECIDKGYAIYKEGSLVCLVGGRFCIVRVVGVGRKGVRWVNSLCLVGVEVALAGGEVRLTKRKIRCYMMSSLDAKGYALQPAQ